jgi:4-nitrophenyl phosphatase
MIDFSTILVVVSDMDGVLWVGDVSLPGLAAFFEMLRTRALPLVLATNNSGKSAAEYVGKLRLMGVDDIAERSIVTSRTALVEYLIDHYPAGTAIYVIGSAGLIDAIESAGFPPDTVAEIVVIGIDFSLTYDKLRQAALLLRNGADFLATNGDVALPAPEGIIPGNGAILAALEAATGRTPIIIGKPSRPMFESALRVLGTTPEQTVMIGDRLDTDIAGGRAAGCRTVLVLSGATEARALAESGVRPDAVYSGLAELVRNWSDGRP